MSEKKMIKNRYEIIKLIGQGGMADVFLGYDTCLNREVAIKILRGEVSDDLVPLQRFEREAQASTSLSHQNIVDVYDVGEEGGHHFIVMEYVKGITLKELIAKRGSLCNEEAVDIMKQLVSAVAQAHSRGIIHRDIKPQNILVKADGIIKLSDFGIALVQDSMQLTKNDSVMGSVHYMAPELVKGKSASEQSDIYAMGIVLFELLTGDVPFKADQAVQVALKHMHEEVPSVRNINPDVPQSLENIIIKATSKDRGFRYQSAQHMLDDISTCLDPRRRNERKNVVVHTEGPLNPDKNSKIAQKKTKKKRKVKLVGILAALFVMVAIAGIYFALSLSGIFTPKSKMTMVPHLEGVTVTEAKQLCEDNELMLDTANISYTLTDNVEKGLIISLTPDAETEVAKNSRVSIVVSSGIGQYIDDYVGWNINDAKTSLANYPNLHVIIEEVDSDAPAGEVVEQTLLPPHSQFNPNISTDIRIAYSRYPTFTIPNQIIGMNIDEAEELLKGMGAEVLRSTLDTSMLSDEEKANLSMGTVIKVTPEEGTAYTQTADTYVVIYYY